MILCGRVLALAVIHRCYIDVFFTNVFYKSLQKRFVLKIIDFGREDPQNAGRFATKQIIRHFTAECRALNKNDRAAVNSICNPPEIQKMTPFSQIFWSFQTSDPDGL